MRCWPAGAHLDRVVSEDACHAAGAIGNGDRLAGALEGGGLFRVEAVVVGCEGKKRHCQTSKAEPASRAGGVFLGGCLGPGRGFGGESELIWLTTSLTEGPPEDPPGERRVEQAHGCPW